MLLERIERVRQRIACSCARRSREPSSVTLVAVTKGVPIERVRDAAALGLTDFGENRVQEAREKQRVLGSRFKVQGGVTDGPPLEPLTSNLAPIRWHLVGHLQRNKARPAVQCFDAIHSVDSIELVNELERQADRVVQGSRVKVQGGCFEPIRMFVQVNVSGEPTKFGCRPHETATIARVINVCRYLRLSGLMTIAPFSSEPERSRPYFRTLRQLREDLAPALNLQPSTLNLSMGMSQDFEVAIEEGADIVRIGTAIFGAREPGHSEWGMRSAE